jgi:hypothetical protein
MGMYTELVLKTTVSETLPPEVEAVLQHLFGGLEDKPDKLPDHEFFTCPRWDFIGQCSSFYHHPEVLNSYTNGYIFSRSDLKNYAGEIEAFINWLQPYIKEEVGKCIGWSWNEEELVPTLLYKA